MAEETAIEETEEALRHHNKLVLQLTRPALEKLLDGDDEVAVQVRHAAAKALVERHFKLFVDQLDSDVLRAMETRITAQASSQLGTYVRKTQGWKTFNTFELSGDVKKAIDMYVATSLRTRIETEVIEAVASLDIPKLVSEAVAQAVDSSFKYEVRNQVNAAITKALQGD